MPFWSIVMPVRRRTQFIAEALSAPLDAPDAEIVMQENPVEGRYPIRDAIAPIEHPRITDISWAGNPEDLGLYPSTNLAVARSSGEWIHILHDDDWVTPDFYNVMRAAIEANPGPGVFFCAYQNLRGGQATHQSHDWPEGLQGPPLLFNLARANPFQICSIVFSRATWERVGQFNVDLPFCADWEYWFRTYCRTDFYHVPRLMAFYREHPENLTWEQKANGIAQANEIAYIESTGRLLFEALRGR